MHTQHNNTEVGDKSNVCTSKKIRDMQVKEDGSYKDVSMEKNPVHLVCTYQI